MKRFLIAALFGAFFVTPVLACPYETEEARITEALSDEDFYAVIEGEMLDLFVKNANDLWNIGWKREDILKIYAIDAEIKADNPHFQVVHLFFIGPDGCIVYYQTTYAAVLELVLDPDPAGKLGLAK